ncbi:MAG: FIVAR domain-containing protein [Clostridiales bacterium]|nr:FIVAR domain-containing protein [Clostridiales bacterium]
MSGYDETDIEDMMVITSNPDSIYGITMNSIENGMGFGYFIGYMYSDMLDIDPVEMCAYFYEQFYHVSDFDSLQSITNTTFSDVTLPEGMSTDLSDYNTDEINEKLAQGKEYYYDNFSDFAETALTTVWPEDQSGIAAGSSKNYTSVDSSGLKLSALASAMADSDTITAKADSYTEDSYAAYEAALTNAQTVMNNSSYFTQSEVNSIRAALVSAKNALVEETVETVAGDTIGIRSGNTFYLYEQLGDTVYSVELDYGRSTDEILIGDWDGDGVETFCVRRGNTYYFSNDTTFTSTTADVQLDYGKDTDEVLVGDWDNDGKDTLCVRRGNTYYFSNDLTSTKAAVVLDYGRETDEILVGDWDGDGSVTICARRDGTTYFFSNDATFESTVADVTVTGLGTSSDEALVGDWDNSGTDELALRRGTKLYLQSDIEDTSLGESVIIPQATGNNNTFVIKWQ